MLRFVFRELLFETIAPAFILALLITHFVGEKTEVLGHSMEPSLYQDQQLIVDKVSYRFHLPARGDIVIVDVPDSDIPLIKRVIGLPGETVEIRGGRVLIDGQLLDEPYLGEVMQSDFGPVEAPLDHLFVMGDNRNASRDSRSIGPVPLDWILARAWVRVWPFDEFGLLE
ncbi:MAG: signal peptidase I [Anaerolineae bacterium]|nr:signal peptidase I [Anaerolineae bacterium]